MEGFREGYSFFSEYALHISGIESGDAYVDVVNTEIDTLVDNLRQFVGTRSNIETLKGDVAEFWHAGTFNINAAARGSAHRVRVDRSHDFGSVDISAKNFKGDYGLKYYRNGVESARQQSKSVFEAFRQYQASGGKDSLKDYLVKRKYQDESVLHDPVYQGQVRVIPSDQLKIATEWLEKKIKEEGVKRPEQVHRYAETLKLLRDKVQDNEGNESIPLSEDEAKKLARIAKEGDVNAEKLGLTSDEFISYEYILKQAFKAGLSAATISLVLRTAPEIINAIKYLVENGEIEEESFKKIGFAAVKGSSEGFIRGTIAADITIACKSGKLGETMINTSPAIIGFVTILAMNTIKNAYLVSIGKMSRYEMTNELVRTMFVGTCTLTLGAISQGFIEIPVLGYLVGSFVGSLVGSFVYSAVYKPVISFCIDTGFTMFGLVGQDYSLPDDVMREIGIEVFDYDRVDYDKVAPKGFQFEKFSYSEFKPADLEMTFLRRGVIGVNQIGYV